MPSPQPSQAAPFMLTSIEFADGAAIPRRFACDGQDMSPPLAWAGLPAGTEALALVMDDPDAGGFVHWVVYNVAAAGSSGLPAGVTPSAPGVPQGGVLVRSARRLRRVVPPALLAIQEQGGLPGMAEGAQAPLGGFGNR